MSIVDQLAISLNRRDEVPNQELAKKIVTSKDDKAIKELVDHLQDKDKNIQADCIKVLDEIGEHAPSLIRNYINDFTKLITSKNNRLVWGAMIVLNHLTSEIPGTIYKLLPQLIDAADNGSVITRDNLVSILIKLEGLKKYQGKVFPLLIEQMTTCPTNQLPMYAENALPVIHNENRAVFITLLQQRLPEVESETKKNRLVKVIKKAGSI